jgi:outer membrane protein OmpA-like peptidoglycan-associated protein
MNHMGPLGIAIDGDRYLRIESDVNGITRNVRLRTLRSGQTTARLEFCSFRRSGPVPLKTIRLTDLQAQEGRPAELLLRVERRGLALWKIGIRRNGAPAREISVRTGAGLLPLIVPAALLLPAAIWFLFLREVPCSSVIDRSAGVPVPLEIRPVPEDSLPADFMAAANSIGDSSEVFEASPSALETHTAEPETASPQNAEPQTAVPPPPAVVYFQPESAVLSSAAREILNRLSGTVQANSRIEIGGHCANYGTERGRKALSAARAEAAADYLRGRIPESVVVITAAYGSGSPVNRSPDAQHLNRRAEISVVP